MYPTEDGGVFVSARSIGDVNVQLIMEKLGGGGNRAAAAAQINGLTLKQAVESCTPPLMSILIRDHSRERNKL